MNVLDIYEGHTRIFYFTVKPSKPGDLPFFIFLSNLYHSSNFNLPFNKLLIFLSIIFFNGLLQLKKLIFFIRVSVLFLDL